MTKKKQPIWGLIALGVCIILVVVAFSGFMISIWSGDDRWLTTGLTLLFPAVITGAVAGVGLSDQ